MKCKAELEYLAMIVQDYLSKLDRSAQMAVAEKAQYCVNMIERELTTEKQAEEPSEPIRPITRKQKTATTE